MSIAGVVQVLTDDGATWADITDYVQSGIVAAHGRQTALTTATNPGTLTFRLRDPDHRFQPGYSGSPYAAWWDTGATVRWTEVVSGQTVTHFFGRMLEPMVSLVWGDQLADGTEASAESYVDVACVDPLTWLAGQAKLVSTFSKYVMLNAQMSGVQPTLKTAWGLTRFWTLLEAGPRYPDLTGQGAALYNPRPLAGAITPQGADPLPGDDASPVAITLLPPTNHGGLPVTSTLVNGSESFAITSPKVLAVDLWVTTARYPAGLTIVPFEILSAADYVRITYDDDGVWHATASINGATASCSLGPTSTDRWQSLGLQVDLSFGLSLWIDRAEVTSSWTGSPGSSVTLNTVRIGRGIDGAMAYVQLYIGSYDRYDVDAHLEARQVGLQGLDRQDTNARWETLLADVAEPDLGLAYGPALTLQQPAKWAGKSLTEALQDAATAESGQFLAAPSGVMTGRTRSYRYNPNIPVTRIPYAWLRSDVQIRRTVINAATVTQAGRGASYARDPASVLRYGERPYEASVDSAVEVDPQVLAQFLIDQYKSPLMLLDQFSVSLVGLTEAQQLAVLQVGLSDVVYITGAPPHWTASMTTLFVEGRQMSEDPGAGRVITFAASPVLGRVMGPSTTIAADGYGRTVSNGYGTADQGGPYTVVGTASLYAVGSNRATTTMAAAATLYEAYLASISVRDVELQVELFMNAASTTQPAGAGISYGVTARRVDASNGYYAEIAVAVTTGAMSIRIGKRVAGADSILATAGMGTTNANNTHYTLAFRVLGSQLAARAWLTAGDDPGAWMVVVPSDTTYAAAGPIGYRALRATGNTNTNPTVRQDNLVARELTIINAAAPTWFVLGESAWDGPDVQPY